MRGTDDIKVRKPPTAEVFAQHLPRQPGKCDWCGEKHDERTPVRNQLKRRHAACNAEWGQIVNPADMRDAVFARDKGVCAECGEDWIQRFIIRPAHKSMVEIGDCIHHTSTLEERELKAKGYYRSNSIIYISRWHCDHRVALWKTTHLPPLQRIEYFKIANVVTLCDECHEVKTSREAAERAKWKDQVERAEQQDAEAAPRKQKSKWPTRTLQSRNGFPPRGSRPMRGKKK